MSPAAAIMIVLALLAGIGFAGMRRIPDGTVCTVHRFGRYVRALGPGLHFCWPFVDQIAHRVSLIGHQVELSLPSVPGSGATVYFQILDPTMAGAALEQIDAMVEKEARARLRTLSADGEAGSLANALKQELNAQLGVLGLRITRCQLRGA
jgi:regulator of protease activity HflC (stomatin/prohibitin superfamily)